MGNNIILIGFMGVGKGRTARSLAKKTGRFAVDCDDLIESMTKKKIKEIFAKSGETQFRSLEQLTAKWLQNSVSDTIVSTGGGFFQVPNIKKTGTVIYLHSEFEQIIAAINAHPKARKKIKKRPLLKNIKAAKALYNKRLPLYRACCDYEISVADKKISEVADKIIKRLRLHR